MVEITKEVLSQIAKLPVGKRSKALKLLGEQEYARCAEDVLYWLDASRHGGIPYVYTLDPHPMYVCKICSDGATYNFDKKLLHLQNRHFQGVAEDFDWDGALKESFVELPTTRSFTLMEYMKPIIHWWLRRPLLALEKSRDMIATWLMVTLYSWDTFFHPGRQNIFQSDDSQKAAELVKRAKFIYDHQPKFLKKYKPYFAIGLTRSGEFRIPDINSEILGFPQGPDQVRQYHPSGIFLDEAAFQVLAEEAFSAVKPAIQNGGRVTMVSSANPGFFYSICRDMTHI